MDLRQLEYFVRVAELGSFSRAASALRVAQPAISRQVRRLEVELKQNLLDRNGRGAIPTDAGRRLLDYARGLLELATRTRLAMETSRGAVAGRVSIGLPPTLAGLLGVPLVTAFRARYPDASLVIVEGLTVAIIDWIATGRVDIGALYNSIPTPAIELEPWRKETLVLIGPRRRTRDLKRVSLRSLPDYPLVIPSRPNAFRVFVETRLAEIGLKPDIAIEIDGVATILGLVASGHGHAVLPREALGAARAPEALVAVPIVAPQLVIPLSIATSSHRSRTPLHAAALQLLKETHESAFKAVRGAR